LVAARLKQVIEDDYAAGRYDSTLERYRQMVKYSLVPEITLSSRGLDLVKEFNAYLGAKSIRIGDDLPNYYSQARNLLQQWGQVSLDDIPVLLANKDYSPRTFNDRRNCLSRFFKYLVRKKKILDNPLEEVTTRKPADHIEKRVPFTQQEVLRILSALKNDTFRKGRYTHSQYYPLVAFMVQTGVRNAEALGLQVRDVKFDTGELRICRSLARTKRGTHAAARKEKGTKTDNIRYIPMNTFLIDLLVPLCAGKTDTQLVFINQNGNSIDDKKFQDRVFKPVLRQLGIPNRDLYAVRHTFATRAVQSGMKPHEVAYLMGDNLDTIIKNYYHKEKIQTVLPDMMNIIHINQIRV
jgi:integrase